MSNEKFENKPIPFIRTLCKHKTEEEIRAAEANFRRYLLLIKRICERLEKQEHTPVEFDKPNEYCDSSKSNPA